MKRLGMENRIDMIYQAITENMPHKLHVLDKHESP